MPGANSATNQLLGTLPTQVASLQTQVSQIQQSSSDRTLRLTITPTSGSTIQIGSIPSGNFLRSIAIAVTTAFNAAATLAINDTNSVVYAATSTVDLTKVDVYEVEPVTIFAAATTLQAIFAANGATTGSATILLTYSG